MADYIIQAIDSLGNVHEEVAKLGVTGTGTVATIADFSTLVEGEDYTFRAVTPETTVYSVPVSATVPVISGVPTISGTEEVGATLTATAASATGTPTPTTSWQWVNSVSGNISGATSATYVLQASDEGDTITVVQTETNSAGTDTATSTATGAIAAATSIKSGLTLTDTFAVASTITDTQVNVNASSLVVACDFTGLDGSAGSGGIIWEQGAGIGAYVGFDADGTFVARCGGGVGRYPASAGYIEVSSANAPNGDGTLVVEFDEATTADTWVVRAWWNGTLLTVAASQVADGSTSWSGTDDGKYLTVSTNGTAGQVLDPVVPYTTASGLRYYENQVIV